MKLLKNVATRFPCMCWDCVRMFPRISQCGVRGFRFAAFQYHLRRP